MVREAHYFMKRSCPSFIFYNLALMALPSTYISTEGRSNTKFQGPVEKPTENTYGNLQK